MAGHAQLARNSPVLASNVVGGAVGGTVDGAVVGVVVGGGVVGGAGVLSGGFWALHAIIKRKNTENRLEAAILFGAGQVYKQKESRKIGIALE